MQTKIRNYNLDQTKPRSVNPFKEPAVDEGAYGKKKKKSITKKQKKSIICAYTQTKVHKCTAKLRTRQPKSFEMWGMKPQQVLMHT